MEWRTAQSLLVLLEQVNKMYPGRSKSADGTIGDQAHQNRVSDHNPNAQGVVTALDITHDPAHGLNIQDLAERLVISNDARTKFVIANKRIWEPGKGWQAYSGPDPHTGHLHISVKAANADITNPWRITMDKATQIAEIRLNHIKGLAKGFGVDSNLPEDQIVTQILGKWKTVNDVNTIRDNTLKNVAKLVGAPQDAPVDTIVDSVAKSRLTSEQLKGQLIELIKGL